jgi:2-dehydropantoate 2-reductase
MPRIAVFGAGAIGCWVGGKLAAGGADVTLIGRPRIVAELAGGLAVSELRGRTDHVTPTLATEPRAAEGADVVLVTVKSGATAEAGRALADVTCGAVISLQNGVRNVSVLRDALPGRTVLAGMVPFNIVRPAPARYHRASGGRIMIEHHDAAAPLTEASLRADLPIELRDDMAGVQWSKLVMNLNNAIAALSGKTLAAELADRDFRRCLAAAQREALALITAAELPLARVTILPPAWIARLLPLPDAVFRAVAGKVVAIDPLARSSMWDDLEAGRPTEIDSLQGEIVTLAERLGRDAPINRALARLVADAERGGRRDWGGAELAAAIKPPTA